MIAISLYLARVTSDHDKLYGGYDICKNLQRNFYSSVVQAEQLFIQLSFLFVLFSFLFVLLAMSNHSAKMG